MRSISVRLFVFALALAALPALAEEKKMEMPKPPAELSQVQYFDGTWGCSGTGFASPFGPEHKTAATVHGATTVGGMWVHLTYDEKKTAANPMPVHAAMYMGYDAAQKIFVLGCFDSFGGYCTQTSKGWNGDTMAFEGTGNVGGQKPGVRDTFVKKGADEVVHTGEMQGEGGKWMKLDEETCRKTKK